MGLEQASSPAVLAHVLRIHSKPLIKRKHRYLIHASAPYWAVGIGLYCLQNAWVTLLLYHGQIVLYIWLAKVDVKRNLLAGFSVKALATTVLPLSFFGPFLYAMFPHILSGGVSLQAWLQAYGLNHRQFLLLIPYFGIIHPILEELHWGRFRGDEHRRWIMCLFFAGYHVLVLARLLSPVWLIISFLVLAGAACLWMILHRRLQGGMIPFLSHWVADMGIIGATYLFAF